MDGGGEGGRATSFFSYLDAAIYQKLGLGLFESSPSSTLAALFNDGLFFGRIEKVTPLICWPLT